MFREIRQILRGHGKDFLQNAGFCAKIDRYRRGGCLKAHPVRAAAPPGNTPTLTKREYCSCSCDVFMSICEALPRSICGLAPTRYAALRAARYVPFHGTFWIETHWKQYGHKSMAFDLFSSNTNGRVWGICLHLCFNMAGQKRRKKQGTRPFISIARKAGKYRVPEGNISSFPPGKHIDKKTERKTGILNDTLSCLRVSDHT